MGNLPGNRCISRQYINTNFTESTAQLPDVELLHENRGNVTSFVVPFEELQMYINDTSHQNVHDSLDCNSLIPVEPINVSKELYVSFASSGQVDFVPTPADSTYHQSKSRSRSDLSELSAPDQTDQASSYFQGSLLGAMFVLVAFPAATVSQVGAILGLNDVEAE